MKKLREIAEWMASPMVGPGLVEYFLILVLVATTLIAIIILLGPVLGPVLEPIIGS